MGSTSSSPGSADHWLAAHSKAAQLVNLPWPERLRSVRHDRSYTEPSFIELAIGLSADIGMPPGAREEWARLAVEAALHGGSARVEELEALAWAHLGTTYRVRDNLGACRSAFVRCAAVRHRIKEPLDVAETLALEASYRWTIRELDQAAELIDEALRLAMPRADDHRIAAYQIRVGIIAADARRWGAAIESYIAALERIDPAVHPRLALIAGHDLACSTIGIGHLETAMCALLQLRNSYDQYADRKLLLCRDSLIASIAVAAGNWREAESRYHEIRQGYVQLHLASQVAFVDLELARLAAKERKWPKAALLAARAARGYAAASSPHEAAAARRLHRRAVGQSRGVGAAKLLSPKRDS